MQFEVTLSDLNTLLGGSIVMPELSISEMNTNRNLVFLSPADLKPYPKNSRTHSDTQVEEICNSIKAFGFTNPILLGPDDVIVAGHGRKLAAEKLGLHSVPCIRLIDLDEDQRKAYVLADNKLAEKAGWDFEILASELDDLLKSGIDMSLTGFSDDEIQTILEENGFVDKDNRDADVIPSVQELAITQRGDVWLLGHHRLMCGDSTNRDDVDRLMNGEKADMVFTDPPYNVASDSANFAADVSKSMEKLSNAEWDKNFNIEPAILNVCLFSKESSTYYIWTNHYLFNRIIEGLKEYCDFTSYLVWAKPNPMPSLSKRHPTWNTELCVYGTRGSSRIVNFPSNGHFLSCREVVKKSDGSHPTQKPLELIGPLIEFSSGKNQLILDLFLGSGSTLIACEKTERKCYGMELSENYCDVIIRRWQEFTGREALLETTQQTFEQVKLERTAAGQF